MSYIYHYMSFPDEDKSLSIGINLVWYFFGKQDDFLRLHGNVGLQVINFGIINLPAHGSSWDVMSPYCNVPGT